MKKMEAAIKRVKTKMEASSVNVQKVSLLKMASHAKVRFALILEISLKKNFENFFIMDFKGQLKLIKSAECFYFF